MRKALIGLILSVSAASSASAGDYIVVKSTDPTVQQGQALDAGARVALGEGKVVTLMRASGEITTLKGGAGGAIVPRERLASVDGARLEALRALVAPPPSGRTFGARRSGVCPTPDTLLKLDDILQVAKAPGCDAVAREALDIYVSRQDREGR